MLEIRFSSQLADILPQTRMTEKIRLRRFSALSTFVHLAVITAFITWAGGKMRLLPPVQVITVDISGIRQVPPQSLPPAAATHHQTPPARVAAPVQPVRSVTSPAPAVTRQQTTIPDADATPSATATPVAAKPVVQNQPPGGAARPTAQAMATTAPSASSSPPANRITENFSARASYMQRCRALIERHKEYPVMARRGGVEGTVMIRGSLGRDGSLRQCQLAKSSGSCLLDNAALRAVRSVDKFPPAPAELFGVELLFELPVSFRLSTE
jgi:periplasmic protein TonB